MGFRNFVFFRREMEEAQASRDIWAYANGVCFYQANYGIADF